MRADIDGLLREAGAQLSAAWTDSRASAAAAATPDTDTNEKLRAALERRKRRHYGNSARLLKLAKELGSIRTRLAAQHAPSIHPSSATPRALQPGKGRSKRSHRKMCYYYGFVTVDGELYRGNPEDAARCGIELKTDARGRPEKRKYTQKTLHYCRVCGLWLCKSVHIAKRGKRGGRPTKSCWEHWHDTPISQLAQTVERLQQRNADDFVQRSKASPTKGRKQSGAREHDE